MNNNRFSLIWWNKKFVISLGVSKTVIYVLFKTCKKFLGEVS